MGFKLGIPAMTAALQPYDERPGHEISLSCHLGRVVRIWANDLYEVAWKKAYSFYMLMTRK